MMITHRRSTVLGAVLGLALAAVPQARAQEAAGGETYDSFTRGREVLNRGVEAHGGLDALRGLRTLSWTWEGEQYLRGQDRTPDATNDAIPNVRHFAVDLPRSRVLVEVDALLPGGYRNHNIQVVDGNQFFAYDAKRFFHGDVMFRDSGRATVTRQMSLAADNSPILLIREASVQAMSVRSLGTAVLEGRPHDVITYATGEGRQVTLYFDAATHLLSRRELLGVDWVFGDQVNAVHFSDYAPVGGLQLPRRVRFEANGVVVRDHPQVATQVNAVLPDSLFAYPAGYVEPASGPPQLRRLAENAWIVEGLNGSYNSMFVDTDSGVLVLEAPHSSPVSEQVIAFINRTLPERPIRWVMVTHHHSDHIGGLRAYVARGVTLLVPPGSEEYLRAVASAPQTILSDALSRAPREPIIRTVRGTLALGSGEREVRVIDVGPSSHVEPMLMAYLPAHQILFQGDLLKVFEHGAVPPGIDVNVDLDRYIREHGLEVRTIAGVHGRLGTMDDLREALAHPGRTAAAAHQH
jgi:glyoxylase-like metal-dependent hydrolase (beta-lactamase superfamily II)